MLGGTPESIGEINKRKTAESRQIYSSASRTCTDSGVSACAVHVRLIAHAGAEKKGAAGCLRLAAGHQRRSATCCGRDLERFAPFPHAVNPLSSKITAGG